MIQAVVFDFDDTLCLTEEACFFLENEIATEMGHAPMSREVHKKNWGAPLEEAIAVRYPGINTKLFMKRVQELTPVYVSLGKFDVIPQENLAVLDKLKRMGKHIAIVTSRSFQEAEHLLQEDHVLTSKIEAFYHKDNSAFIKPDPRVFNQLLLQFDLKPEEVLYIGDAVTDALAAKQAGLHFMADLESGIRKKEDFAGLGVDMFIKRLSDVFKYPSLTK